VSSKFLTPPFLKPGDTLGIVSTARKLTPTELQPALELFEQWGLKIKIGPHLHKEYHQFSGTDQERATDLQWMMEDPHVKAIYCARGGYGSVRVIDHIDWNFLKNKPKWVLGYSDVTALHNHIHTHLNMESIHAPMPLGFPENSAECLEDVRKTLFGELSEIQCDRHPFNHLGDTQGALTGGNLSVLYSLRGTPADIDVKGKILFIEDLDEYLYHIDRMMMNLQRGGWLDEIAGLIVGGMTDMNDNKVPFGKQAIEIIKEFTEGKDYPVAFGFPAGHVDDNRPLRFGVRVELKVREDQTLLTFPI